MKLMYMIGLVLLGLGLSGQPVVAAGSSDNDQASYRAALKPQASSEMSSAKQALSSGEFVLAIRALQTEVKNNPQNADAWNLLGYASRKSGDFTTAEKAYTRALGLNPNHKGALEYMGEMYLSLNQPDNAKKLLARLDALCSFNCAERDELKDAIAAWEASQN